MVYNAFTYAFAFTLVKHYFEQGSDFMSVPNGSDVPCNAEPRSCHSLLALLRITLANPRGSLCDFFSRRTSCYNSYSGRTSNKCLVTLRTLSAAFKLSLASTHLFCCCHGVIAKTEPSINSSLCMAFSRTYVSGCARCRCTLVATLTM